MRTMLALAALLTLAPLPATACFACHQFLEHFQI